MTKLLCGRQRRRAAEGCAHRPRVLGCGDITPGAPGWARSRWGGEAERRAKEAGGGAWRSKPRLGAAVGRRAGRGQRKRVPPRLPPPTIEGFLALPIPDLLAVPSKVDTCPSLEVWTWPNTKALLPVFWSMLIRFQLFRKPRLRLEQNAWTIGRVCLLLYGLCFRCVGSFQITE